MHFVLLPLRGNSLKSSQLVGPEATSQLNNDNKLPGSSTVIICHSSEMSLQEAHSPVPTEIYCNQSFSCTFNYCMHQGSAVQLLLFEQSGNTPSEVFVVFRQDWFLRSDGSGRDHAFSQICCVSVIFTARSVSSVQIVMSLTIQTCLPD